MCTSRNFQVQIITPPSTTRNKKTSFKGETPRRSRRQNPNLDPGPSPSTTAAESNLNTAPQTSTADDLRGGGEEGNEKKDPSLKPANATVVAPEAALASGAAADLEKKLRRAERFGLAVQLSEEEKRRT